MLKTWVLFFSLFGIGSVCSAAMPFEHLLYKGRAVPFYGSSTDPTQQQILDAVRGAGVAERMAAVASLLYLKNDIGVGFESCGRVNAFFSPARRSIVICSEFLWMIGKLAAGDSEGVGKLPKEQFAKIIDGAIWSIYFHELGHALVATNHISITGREEDVADQFAVWFALNFVDLKKTPILSPTIWLWRELGKGRNVPAMNQDELRLFMSDEHSLDEQRIYNIACWAYGTNTEAGNGVAKFARLPEQRAARCQGEYATVERGMMTHFRKYFRAKPLSGRW